MKQTLQKILAILLAAMLLCSLILFAFPAVLPQNFGDGTANEETLPPSNEVPDDDALQDGEAAPPSADEPPDDDAPQGGGSIRRMHRLPTRPQDHPSPGAVRTMRRRNRKTRQRKPHTYARLPIPCSCAAAPANNMPRSAAWTRAI